MSGYYDQPLSARGRTALRHTVLALALMVLGSVGLDQVSKIQAHDNLMTWNDASDPTLYKGRRFPLVDFGRPLDENGQASLFYLSFNFNYVRNLGAAWGVMSGLPAQIRVPLFHVVTVFAVLLIAVYFRSTPPEHRASRFGLALVLSGAIGNFIDRLRLGYVIDFIDVRWSLFRWRYDFPNFNIADSAITVGVALLILDMMVLESLRRRKAEGGRAATPASAGEPGP